MVKLLKSLSFVIPVTIVMAAPAGATGGGGAANGLCCVQAVEPVEPAEAPPFQGGCAPKVTLWQGAVCKNRNDAADNCARRAEDKQDKVWVFVREQLRGRGEFCVLAPSVRGEPNPRLLPARSVLVCGSGDTICQR